MIRMTAIFSALALFAAFKSAPPESNSLLKPGFNDLGPLFQSAVQTQALESGHIFLAGTLELSKEGLSVQRIIIFPDGTLRKYEPQETHFVPNEKGRTDYKVVSGENQIIDILDDDTEVWSVANAPSKTYLVSPNGEKRELQSFCGGSSIDFKAGEGSLAISRDAMTVYRVVYRPNGRIEKCSSGKTTPIAMPMEGRHGVSEIAFDGTVRGFTIPKNGGGRAVWLMSEDGAPKLSGFKIEKFFSADTFTAKQHVKRGSVTNIHVDGKLYVPELPSESEKAWFHFSPWDITKGGASVGMYKFNRNLAELDDVQAASVMVDPQINPDFSLGWKDMNWMAAYWSPNTGAIPLSEVVELPVGYKFSGSFQINSAGWIVGTVRSPSGTMNPFVYVP